MTEKIAAVTRINYGPRADLIEITGRRQVGGVPARITKAGYTVANGTVMGWGEHNAVIHVDTDWDDIGGYWLATIADA